MSNVTEESETKQIVIPGEILSEDPRMMPGRGAIKDGQKIRSIFIGLKNIRGKYVNVVPLKGSLYTPEVGDKVIGKIIEKTVIKWIIDINAKEEGSLRPVDVIDRNMKRPYNPGKRTSKRDEESEAMDLYQVGDLIICKIMAGDRRGSMIKLLKDLTTCKLFVAKNGRIWLHGKSIEHERLLIDAIRKIEREAHTSRLTDRIQYYIMEEKTKRGLN
jgi:exosome complex component RRP4